MKRWTSLTALAAAGALAACDPSTGPAGPATANGHADTLAVRDVTAPVADALGRVVPTLGDDAASLGTALRALVFALERADVPAVQRAGAAATLAINEYDATTDGRDAAEVEVIRLAVTSALDHN